MRQGNEKLAFDCLYASALAEDSTEVLDKFMWVSAFKRPAVAVRWGIGVDLKVSPKSYEGNYYPVGSTQSVPDRASRGNRRTGGPGGAGGVGGAGGAGGGSGRRPSGAGGSPMPGAGMMPGAGAMPGAAGMGMGSGGYPGAGGARSEGAAVLSKTVGELGDELQRRLRDKIQAGDYGEMLVQFGALAAQPAAGGGYGSGYPGMPGMAGMPGMPGMPGSGSAGPLGSGPPGSPAAGSAGAGAGSTAPGASLPDGESPGGGPGAPNRQPPGAGRGGASGGGTATSLGAGVTLLGEGTSKELLGKAADLGIDVVVVFEVEVKENVKTRLITNETRMVVYDVASGESLEKSKSLNNITVQKFRDEKKDDEDPVTVTFDKFFAALDGDSEHGLKVCEMPAELRPEHVESRVAAILESEDFERLPALAEIRFYCHRGLISDGLLEKSFQKVLGEADGSKLASGTEAERAEVVSTLMPRENNSAACGWSVRASRPRDTPLRGPTVAAGGSPRPVTHWCLPRRPLASVAPFRHHVRFAWGRRWRPFNGG